MVALSRDVILGLRSGDCVRLGEGLISGDPFGGVLSASSNVSFFSSNGVSGNPPDGFDDELIYNSTGQIRSKISPALMAWSRREVLQMMGVQFSQSRRFSSGIGSQDLAGPIIRTI